MNADHPVRIYARSTGLLVQDLLACGAAATVIGSTSRGLFLLAPSSRVVFLSYEAWRSPLTVNTGQPHKLLRDVSVGAQARFSLGAITIPAAGVTIDLRTAPVWAAPPAPPATLSADQRRMKLVETAARVTTRSDAGFSPLLSAFINLPVRSGLEDEEQVFLQRLQELRLALRDHDLARAGDTAAALLGYGRGLTPSGDDLISGLLLALNRWGHTLPPCNRLAELNTRLVQSAYTQTTALSANIIAAAAAGQADERLVQSLDAFFTHLLDPAKAADLLLSYGGSSGVDALTGFTIALSI
jgi:hypothetical protein